MIIRGGGGWLFSLGGVCEGEKERSGLQTFRFSFFLSFLHVLRTVHDEGVHASASARVGEFHPP